MGRKRAEVKRVKRGEMRSELRSAGIALLALAIAIGVVFGRVTRAGFLNWDDQMHVSHNPDLNPPTAESVAKYWRSPQLGMYIPVVYTAWAGLAWLARLPAADAEGVTLDPSIFHLANLMCHLLASYFVWEMLRRSLRVSAMRNWAAGAGALFFALHPLEVEPVAWATGLKDMLSGALALGALLIYVIALEKEREWSRARRSILFTLATLTYGAALLAKPSTTCVPLMAIVIDRVIFRRPWRESLPLIAVWALMAIVPVVLTRGAQLSLMIFRPSLELRPFVALDAIGFYMGKVFLPLSLGIDQGRSPMVLLRYGTLLWSWVPAFALCVMLWFGRRRLPIAIAPWLLFLAGLAPVLGLSPFIFQDMSTVADRFAYLAMLGPALLLAEFIVRFPRRVVWIGVGAGIALLANISFVQTGYWHDDRSLMAHSLEVTPDSELATQMLAAATSRDGDLDRGNALYRQALAMKWDDAAALIGLGGNMHKQQRLPEAEHYLQKAVLLEPNNADARFNCGNVLLAEQRPDLAIKQYEVARKRRPRDLPLLLNLGAALAMSGRWEESEAVFRNALDVAPASAEVHCSLARVLEHRGDLGNALAEYETALNLRPQLAQAQNGRARIVGMMRR